MSTERLVPFPNPEPRIPSAESRISNPESASTPLVTFLAVSSELLARGYRVRFLAEGWSMHPTIRDKELITVASVVPSAIRRGDIVLCRHRRGVVAHRVVAIERGRRGMTMFVLRGDAAEGCDAPAAPEQVLGQVLAVDRAGRRVSLSGRWARLRRVLRLCGSRLKGTISLRTLRALR